MMRHSSISLTMQLYADRHLIPLADEMRKVQRLFPSPTASPKIGKACPNLSKDGKSRIPEEDSLKFADPYITRAHESESLSFAHHMVAEGEGFEPSDSLTHRTISNRVP